MLFEFARGPWVLLGVLCACVDRLWQGANDFQVTSKQRQRRPLRLAFIAPHLLLASLGALTALILGSRAGEARGYVLLILISALGSDLAASFALGLDHRLKRLPLGQLGRHYGLVAGALALVLLQELPLTWMAKPQVLSW
jgi:hypothetical protein